MNNEFNVSLEDLNTSLEKICQDYQKSFAAKKFGDESEVEDALMQVFGITQDIKTENKQYWGRELGMCWQRLVTELCRKKCQGFMGAIKDNQDELCDLVVSSDAIDTKYRIGSGDSGTLKKFRGYAKRLKEQGYKPVMLILREDNLPAAINACKEGGWDVKVGEETYSYLHEITGLDLHKWLQDRKNLYDINS